MKRFTIALAACAPLFVAAQVPPSAIDYWLTQYDGADLVSGPFDCQAPAIPAVSTTNDEIQAVTQGYRSWQQCYQAAAANLDDANNPVGKRIPKPVLDAMTVAQRSQALDHLEDVYDKRGAQLGTSAGTVIGQFSAWKKQTEAFVASANKATDKARTDAVTAQLAVEREYRDMRHPPVSSFVKSK